MNPQAFERGFVKAALASGFTWSQTIPWLKQANAAVAAPPAPKIQPQAPAPQPSPYSGMQSPHMQAMARTYPAASPVPEPQAPALQQAPQANQYAGWKLKGHMGGSSTGGVSNGDPDSYLYQTPGGGYQSLDHSIDSGETADYNNRTGAHIDDPNFAPVHRPQAPSAVSSLLEASHAPAPAPSANEPTPGSNVDPGYRTNSANTNMRYNLDTNPALLQQLSQVNPEMSERAMSTNQGVRMGVQRELINWINQIAQHDPEQAKRIYQQYFANHTSYDPNDRYRMGQF
jgi:hypothetical protein